MASKADNMEMKYDSETEMRFQDLYLRLLFTPLFGLLIPYLAGLMQHSSLGTAGIFLSYLYFILVSFLLWEGNLRILQYNLKTTRGNVRGYVIRLFRYIGFTVVSGVGLLYLWYLFPNTGPVHHKAVWFSEAMILIAIIIIASFYESVILIYKNNMAQLQNEKISTAMLKAELESLKNKIDPHFIFNSLNTLSYLIETNSVAAREFCDGLSDVYRYILRNKNTSFVPLTDEMLFLKNYRSLLQVRFGEAVQFDIEDEKSWDPNLLVAPVSLQILVENALKHNAFDQSHPLRIGVSLEDGSLKVQNRKRPLYQKPESHGMGLKILNERLHLLMKKSLHIEDTPTDFIVRIPLPQTI
jgi:sensor histidine kinase YesM